MRFSRFLQGTSVALCALAAVARAQAADNCADLAKFAMPAMNVKITKAATVPAGLVQPSPMPGQSIKVNLPDYCRVEGVIDSRKGSDGKTYGIGFALALPSNWTGQFLFQGGGGLDGILNPPLGTVAAGGNPALARGMAVVSTDSGHRSTQGFDASFFADQQATLDFEYASIGKVTMLAKAIIADYYRNPPAHSYFAGCSMGGREAMVAAQRYPAEFDGAIAGAPAMHVGFSGIGDRWASVHFNAIAPKDADGKLQPAAAFSAGDKKLIIDKLLEQCDANDGIKDGMIFNRAACKFNPSVLKCDGAKTDACLSADQVNALELAFTGPKDSKGNQVYPGFYFDTGITAAGFIPGLLDNGSGPVGPTVATSLDVDREASRTAADPQAAVGDTANWVNLNSFASHGAKLIFFHGVSDPWFSAMDTVDYYQRMTQANGAWKVVQTWSRLFLSPGMGHCSGGAAALDQFDLLTALTDWVEKGKAPDSVVATGAAFPNRSRPLCAYPKHAQYEGHGAPENAKNFSCQDEGAKQK